ncbi:MAG: hypothetical protein ACRC14_06475 [Paracoccaceae bacterium]
MSSSDHAALAHALDTAQAPPSVLQTLARILALALPFAVGAAITSALNLGKVALLSRAPDTGALTVFSLLLPVFIVILALMEGLAITNQVFSAKSKQNWPKRGVLKSSRRLSAVGVGLFALLAAAGYALSQFVSFDNAALDTMLRYFPLFILSMSAFLVFDVYFGALRGQGHVMRGLLPFAGLVAIDLGVTWWLVAGHGWGFEAVLVGNLAGPLLMLPVLILMLRAKVASGPEVPNEALSIRLRQLSIGVGIPVCASILVGFVSSTAIVPVLSDLGEENAAAFFVLLRFRIAFMIPAIAIGSAIAILCNQAAEEGVDGHRRSFLMVGAAVLLAFYGGLTAMLPFWSGPVLDLLVPEGAIALRLATEEMLQILALTFFLVSGSAMFQVILEQLGRGAQVLLITIVTEIATCGAVIWFVLYRAADLQMVLQILVALAAVTFALFALQFALLLRKTGDRNAV